MKTIFAAGGLGARMHEDRWLTVEEVAKTARVHEQTVRRWLRAGQLRGHLISRRAGYRIRASDLDRFLTGESQGGLEEGKLAA